ncbi:MAG: DNA-directed RNA polymerase subunit alpha [Patescibacteria group bacterium]
MRVSPNDVKIKREQEIESKGVFVVEPLPQGYGYTFGNALRRVLLSSLPGAAVSQVKFSGVSHQFSTIPGVKEDVVEICLNLKKLRIKVHGDSPSVLKLEKTGPGEVKASDFDLTSDAEVVNKDLHIATLADKNSKIEFEVVVEKGVGYVPSEHRETNKVGVILLDSVFSPVSVVSYKVEPTRVGREINLDKLVVSLQTDGTITPFDAFVKASDILKEYFERLALGVEEVGGAKEVVKEEKNSQKSEEVFVEELPLPTRTVNALRKAGIKTLEDLAGKMPDELTEIKNLGEKSIEEIKKLLEKEGYSLNNEA